MPENHLKPLVYDQNITGKSTKWPKSTSKRRNDAKKQQKRQKTSQKFTLKWPKPTFPCYTEAHLENQGGPLAALACELRSRGAPLVFSVGFGNILFLPARIRFTPNPPPQKTVYPYPTIPHPLDSGFTPTPTPTPYKTENRKIPTSYMTGVIHYPRPVHRKSPLLKHEGSLHPLGNRVN